MKFMVAFNSPKRSASVVTVAAHHALATGAELVLLRVLPDAEKVGVVAQLIASERPHDKAQKQLNLVVGKLREKGINAVSVLRVGEVAAGISSAATELGADLLFVGTANTSARPRFYMMRDPVVQYLVDNCPVSLLLVREDDPQAQPGILESLPDLN